MCKGVIKVGLSLFIFFAFYVFAKRYKIYLNEKNFKTLINDQLADLHTKLYSCKLIKTF